MKKSVLVIALFTIALQTTSCRKEYNCTCTTTDSSGGHAINKTTVSSSKKNAQKNCDASVPESSFGKVCVIG